MCPMPAQILCSMSALASKRQLSRDHSGKATIRQGNDLLVRNNLVVFNRIPELLPIRRLHAAEEFSSNAKIHLANGRSKAFRSPPLHHVLRVCPRLPNQLAWGIKNSCNDHPLDLI